MNSDLQFEGSASSSRSKHEGESSSSLCDRLSRTRGFSQRQLPTDHDYAVPTREYQTDQSSLNLAPTAACPALERRNKQRQQQKQQPDRCAEVDGSLHIRDVLMRWVKELRVLLWPAVESLDRRRVRRFSPRFQGSAPKTWDSDEAPRAHRCGHT
jgi:hypothetical protein